MKFTHGKVYLNYIVLLLTAIIISSTTISAQNEKYGIKYYTVDDGLSQNEVTSILRDRLGFMWFATRGGLNRFDGSNFTHFKPNPYDANSLSNPSIETIYEDKNGIIWIGTKSGGLCKYDTHKEKFTHVNFTGQDTVAFDNLRVISLLIDDKNNLWVGTWGNGLYIYNPKTKKSIKKLDNYLVHSIKQLRDKSIWVVSTFGVYQCQNNSDEFELIRRLPHLNLLTVVEDPDSTALWLTGWDRGVLKFDYEKEKIRHFSIPSTHDNLAINNIYSTMLDKQGTLWLGTWGAGLWKFDRNKETFSHVDVRREYLKSQPIDKSVILYINQDCEDNIWIGTDGSGICKVSEKSPFNRIDFSTFFSNYSVDIVRSVFVDNNNRLWIGTRGNGILWTDDFKTINPVEISVNQASYGAIKTFCQTGEEEALVGIDGPMLELTWDNNVIKTNVCKVFSNNERQNLHKPTTIVEIDGKLWVGTQQRSLFVLKKNEEGNYDILKNYLVQSGTKGALQNSRITTIIKDTKNRIWIGTYGGLHLYSPENDNFVTIDELSVNKKKLTSPIVLHVAEDSDGKIWVGTPSGLNCLLENEKGKFAIKYYTQKDGLPDDYIHSIIEDNNKKLWIATNNGISKFSLTDKKFTNFDRSDGILSNSFSETACAKDSSGNIFFGGAYGISYFNPSDIQNNQKMPQMVFTSLRIFNEQVEVNQKINNRIHLENSINDTKNIELDYDDKEFSVEFSVIDFHSPGKCSYAYKLVPGNNHWIHIGNRKRVSFNNLPAGNYTLYIKGANSNNIWNEKGISMNLKINPPYWKTWYAYVLYILSFALLIFTIRWVITKQEQMASRLRIEKINSDKEREINELKLRFFTNISHEIRTPLTMIIAPVKEMLNTLNQGTVEYSALNQKLEIVHLNAMRLMKLVSQLIDFRKAETGNIKLRASETNITDFTEEVCMSFAELADINKLKFKKSLNIKDNIVWLDHDKFEIILNNLISNAFKFAGEKGEITVKFTETKDTVRLHVADNGAGIPEAELDKIFDRFYQARRNKNYGSSGIGLALVKRYVELHSGTIKVESVPNKKTEFIVSLLKGKEHIEDNQLVTDANFTFKSENATVGLKSAPQIRKKINPDKKAALVLIVEDNNEVRTYVESLLSNKHRVITAVDGKDGFSKAIEHQPDIIVSDVMMPEMDGFELCSKIKTNSQVDHIPIILLTAKSANNMKIYSTKLGADEYITKPFDPEYLEEKINSLLLARQKMKEHFSRKIKLEPKDIEITPYEEKIIKKAIQIVEDNLTNPDLSSDFMAEKFNMSKSTLYRQLKSASGISTGEFIRSIRIKRAAQLLLDRERTITEIAYETGFNDLKTFRQSFNKFFNTTPQQYRKNIGNQSNT